MVPLSLSLPRPQHHGSLLQHYQEDLELFSRTRQPSPSLGSKSLYPRDPLQSYFLKQQHRKNGKGTTSHRLHEYRKTWCSALNMETLNPKP